MRNLFDETTLHIPRGARDLAGFRTWAVSPRFPERGRIDFLAGDLEVDMSPEELHTHGLSKAEIATALQSLVAHRELGHVYIDRARISNPLADFSVEPDVVVVFWQTLDEGRCREIPGSRRKGEGRFIEMEGAPDLVVEVVSDSSAHKDLVRLPPFYATAGVPELWLVDARRKALRFEIQRLGMEGYEKVEEDPEGWTFSPQLGLRFRLMRREVRPGRWTYRLEHGKLPPAGP
jgi:Uma2 family endonuclease